MRPIYTSRLMKYDDILMLILALVSVALLGLELTVSLTASQTMLFDSIDFCIATIFLSEFTVRLMLAKHRSTFLRRHWWDLLAAIPVSIPATQILRLLRVMHVVLHLRLAREDEQLLQAS